MIVAPGGCMVRPIFAVLGSFVVLTNLLEAQASKRQYEYQQLSTSDPSTVVGLIQQSGDGFAVEPRSRARMGH